VLSQAGEVFDLGRNALSSLELAGVCFSPDGRVLFVNLQHDAIMLAITGPFPEVRLPGTEPPVGLSGASCAVGRRSARRKGAAGAAFTVAVALASRRGS
jgi:secreted PhoX family phosphatase